MAAALSLALLLLGGGLLVRRQARAQEGLAALHAQLGLQQRMAGTAAARQQRQVADLELSLQQMGSRLASSAATVAALEQRVEAHSTVSTSLRAELSAVRDGMAQLQLASAAAAAGVAGNATSDAAGEAALAAWQRLQQMVQGKVAAALELFAADGTGLPDYALAAAGATVVAHSPAHTAPGTDSTLLSRLRSGGVHPQANKAVLSPGPQPGTCLPLVGTAGWVDVRLSQPITPTAFSYEHIPAAIAHIDVRSAPRRLALLGFLGPPPTPAPAPAGAAGAAITAAGSTLGSRTAAAAITSGGVALGASEYEARKGRSAVQTFQLLASPPGLLVDHVRLVIESNHGQDYTCVYRLRVHGTPVSFAASAAA